MSANKIVRPASSADACACIAIYRPYVEDTAITFETEVPTPAEMAARIAAARDTHEWLVLDHGGNVIGAALALRRA
jgi:phosphinothricin acetyltransferase